ncbi:hypothetical protein M8818_002084 [Zalaria obscura]|uniref:Uncharacterized protein n=1 Tax=Zalaria obscura TaxID=2024903 RepID=A0ACC3SIV3_9PEZI
MTSYECRDGNTYNGVKDPQYRALSYTWGRWELTEGVKPFIKELRISGITWDVPRMNPAHFTVHQMEQVLHRACQAVSLNSEDTPTTNTKIMLPPTEWVWLDIACIDQDPASPQNAIEIGRQAKIFKNATGVLIWLSTCTDTDKGRGAITRDGLRNLVTNLVTRDFNAPWPSENDTTPNIHGSRAYSRRWESYLATHGSHRFGHCKKRSYVAMLTSLGKVLQF